MPHAAVGEAGEGVDGVELVALSGDERAAERRVEEILLPDGEREELVGLARQWRLALFQSGQHAAHARVLRNLRALLLAVFFRLLAPLLLFLIARALLFLFLLRRLPCRRKLVELLVALNLVKAFGKNRALLIHFTAAAVVADAEVVADPVLLLQPIKLIDAASVVSGSAAEFTGQLDCRVVIARRSFDDRYASVAEGDQVGHHLPCTTGIRDGERVNLISPRHRAQQTDRNRTRQIEQRFLVEIG